MLQTIRARKKMCGEDFFPVLQLVNLKLQLLVINKKSNSGVFRLHQNGQIQRNGNSKATLKLPQLQSLYHACQPIAGRYNVIYHLFGRLTFNRNAICSEALGYLLR